jgi:hypothetical protein
MVRKEILIMTNPNIPNKNIINRIAKGVAIGVTAAMFLVGCAPAEEPTPPAKVEQPVDPTSVSDLELDKLPNEADLEIANEKLNTAYGEVSSFDASVLGGNGTETQGQSIRDYGAALQGANEQLTTTETKLASAEDTTYDETALDALRQTLNTIDENGSNMALGEYNTRLLDDECQWLDDRATNDPNFLSQLADTSDISSSQKYWNYQNDTLAYSYLGPNGSNRYSINLPKGAENADIKDGPFQSQWQDESYNVKNDSKYDLSYTPGWAVDLGTIEVDGIGKVEAQSFIFDNDSISPEAVVSNIRATGYFSRFATVDMDNEIIPADWLDDVWGKSPEGIYVDTAGGQGFKGNYPPDHDYFAYSKKEHNNQQIDESVYSGGYMANTDPKHPVCFGGAAFKINGNCVSLIKFVDKIGIDMNSNDGLAKLNGVLDDITSLQISIANDGVITVPE